MLIRWVLYISEMLVLRKLLVLGGDVCTRGPSLGCRTWYTFSQAGYCSKSEQSPAAGSDKVVSYEQLKRMLASHNVQLFDVRNPEEFQAGRIPGSTNIPLDILEEALKLENVMFKKSFNVEKPAVSDDNIVFHCRSGKRSFTALETAITFGYSRARHYGGGYLEWEEKEGLTSPNPQS
ncbi:thiosulfate:glutathione sulfurtransferase [Erpetoichthys calabaricus]|uniref:thiosulfate:glutathione sulfurtransferase n=1 Tax=Erpetoichthys calabaricus TaxID=27687 RepID=UPI002234474F|nr:thiosulfate:glutathione sulfurtransferase [Erpetoichthys calabaricus]